eukprot:TRINITY_DN15899_c0_g1_i1.p1 TRINITY_DN15899_c0_g1~~TRINITY_DN15899_c0_g1_i1.p1  ORF type:complete len:194 (+),score=34.73 TRINITY_DN15899_c0_g1_i1:58-639(+)
MAPRSIALVCSSNQNRSMEAHNLLLKKGFNVSSYGVGAQVKLPGPRPDRPNVYEFGTPYAAMYDDLLKQNEELYTANGILAMLERNKSIKRAPERWADGRAKRHPVVITFEERVYDLLIEDLTDRGSVCNEPVHVFNIEVKDNHEEAVMGAKWAFTLAQLLETVDDLDEQVEAILQDFDARTGKQLLHSVSFY